MKSLIFITPSVCVMGEGIRVITLDDEPDQSELLKIYLEDYDSQIDVESYTSPVRLLQMLKERKYDCIVADHILPGTTGLELAQQIRKVSSVPIILYTGRGSQEIAAKAFSAGIDDYMRKEPDPRHFEVLAKRIRRIVEKHRNNPSDTLPRLPDYPKVETQDSKLYILEEDGQRMLWGDEYDPDGKVAQQMELELKAIRYVRNELADFVTGLTENLFNVDIPLEGIPDIIYEGYLDLLKWFKRLDDSNNMRRKPD